jgi:hypothetical protein
MLASFSGPGRSDLLPVGGTAWLASMLPSPAISAPASLIYCLSSFTLCETTLATRDEKCDSSTFLPSANPGSRPKNGVVWCSLTHSLRREGRLLRRRAGTSFFWPQATRGIWEFDVSSGGAAGLVTCCRPIGQLPAEGSPQAACLGPPPPRSRHTPGSFAANYPEGAVACCCSIFRQRQKLTLSRHLSMTISLRLNSGGLIPMDNFFAIHQFRLQFSSNYRERGC